jgi:hypothetical protein
MKTLKSIPLIAAFILAAFFVQTAAAGTTKDKKKNDQQTFVSIKGKVVDKETLNALVFASVTLKESNVATVTNIDGEFIIKIPENETSKSIEISYLGYKNKVIPLNEMKNSGYKNIITMEPAPIPIKEIIIKPLMPDQIMEKAISSIGKNYPEIPNLMTAFYRETIRKNRTYVSIGEAVVEIFKAPYVNDMRFDGTRIYKGRKSTDVEKVDTILFKLQGGPVTSLELDMANLITLLISFKNRVSRSHCSWENFISKPPAMQSQVPNLDSTCRTRRKQHLCLSGRSLSECRLHRNWPVIWLSIVNRTGNGTLHIPALK